MGRRRWLARVMALAALAGLVAGACGDDDGGTSGGATAGGSGGTTSSSPDEPRRGGTLRMNVWLDAPRGLDPTHFQSLSNASNDGHRALAIFDFFLMVDPRTFEVKPRIAESFTSSDALTWTFKIRPNVKFSDGTPYDAEAVKFNWQRFADPANRATAQAAAEEIASMEVVDPLTLRVTLKSPNGQFPRIAATRLAAVGSPTALRADPEGFATKPVGAGPFVVQEWVRDSRLILTRNPDYWDAPRPYVDRLEFRVIPDFNQSYASLTAGEADMMYTADVSQADEAAKAGFDANVYTMNGGRTIVFNTTKPPFDDVRARRAMMVGFDLDTMAQVVDRGLKKPPETIFREGTPFYEQDLELPRFDPAEAQKLIDEYAQATGKAMEFDLIYSSSTKPYAEFLQAQLGQFKNLRVTITDVPTNFTGEVVKRQYQAALFALQMPDPEPEAYDYLRSDSSRNISGYKNARLDEALVQGHTSLDQASRKQAYRRMQEILIDESVMAWYSLQTLFTLVDRERVSGFETFNDGIPRLDLMWIKG